MKTLWFKRKEYGYGWYPATWQGWVVLIAFVTFEIWNFLRIDAISSSPNVAVISFIPETIGATIILIAICLKTGESPRWQWGGKSLKR